MQQPKNPSKRQRQAAAAVARGEFVDIAAALAAAAREREPETPRKETTKKGSQANPKVEDKPMPEAAAEEDSDEEKRKRKEEKRKRKQAVAEAAATDEAPGKKAKMDSAAAAAAAVAAFEETSQASASETKFTVIVSNLPLTCPEEALRKDFSDCGEIASLRVPGKKKGHGIAFITYTSTEDFEKALKLNASDYEGCTLRVNHSGKEALQIFVGGLPSQPAEATLRQHFGTCGKIAAFLVPLSARNCPKGIAYIAYTTQEGVDKALALDGTDYSGRSLKVKTASSVEKAAKEEKASKEEKAKEAKALKVFVGGLPFEIDETKLMKKFSKCGEIVALKKISPSSADLSERKLGIVFITFKSRAGLEKVLALDGTDYKGCTLKVKHAGDGKGKVRESQQEEQAEDDKGESKKGKGKGNGRKSKGKGNAKKGKKGRTQ